MPIHSHHAAALLLLAIATPGCGRSELPIGELTDAATADVADSSEDAAEPRRLTKIVAGHQATCWLRDGALSCWGYLAGGQLCNGTAGFDVVVEPRPMDVGTVVDVTMGENGLTFLLRSREARYCGSTWCGLGESITRPTTMATDVVRLFGAGRGRHAWAGRRAGSVVGFGHNPRGQIPGSSPSCYYPAVEVPLARGAEVILGNYFTCLLAEGRLRCSGLNSTGQLGDGTLTDHPDPRPVPGLDAVTLAGAGFATMCAVDAGRLLCWGYNKYGTVGDGTTVDRTRPVPVPGIAGRIISLAGGNTVTCALVEEGRVWCWGDNGRGELGNGTGKPRLVPGLVPDLDQVVELTVGVSHVCARRRDDSVWCWGANKAGEVGDGSLIDQPRPVRIGL